MSRQAHAVVPPAPMLSEEPQIAAPCVLLALTEAHRAAIDIFSLGLSRNTVKKFAPRGDGHAVMVLPGFMGDDGYNSVFRRYLTGLGYAVHGWGQGRNLGPRNGVLENLEERLVFLSEKHEGPVSLVGHSLGGIFARELARAAPDRVRQVISLGSPFGRGRMSASLPARLFVALNPREELPLDENTLHEVPPVPTTAIYSKGDGVVNWKTTLQEGGHPHCQNIQVRGSHSAMTFNPAIWFLVAERLAASKQNWQPFERARWTNLFFPSTSS